MIRRLLAKRRFMRDHHWTGAHMSDYLDGDLRARLARHHGGNVDCAFWGWNRAWLDPGFRAWNIEDRLPAVTVPVTFTSTMPIILRSPPVAQQCQIVDEPTVPSVRKPEVRPPVPRPIPTTRPTGSCSRPASP